LRVYKKEKIMILGFGSTEKQVMEDIKNDCLLFCRNNIDVKNDHYLSDESISRVKHYVEKLSKDSIEASDKYKKSVDFPERYSEFWAHVLGDASKIVFILKFHHINRKHPFSEDGWASLCDEIIFYFDIND
jgi:hypothetical protein